MQMANERRAETGELEPRRERRRDLHGRVGRRFDPSLITEKDDLLSEILADPFEGGQLPAAGEFAGILREARDESGRLPVGPDPEGVGVPGFQLVGEAAELGGDLQVARENHEGIIRHGKFDWWVWEGRLWRGPSHCDGTRPLLLTRFPKRVV